MTISDRSEEEAVAIALGCPTCRNCGALLVAGRVKRRRRTRPLDVSRFCGRACQTAATRKLVREMETTGWVRDDLIAE